MQPKLGKNPHLKWNTYGVKVSVAHRELMSDVFHGTK